MCGMAATKFLMLRNTIILKSHLISTSTFLILLTKKVRVDNNENYAKMPIMLNQFSKRSM